MNALVIGGAGFIGGHLCEALLDRGHDVVALDNFDPYYAPEIKEHNVRCARARDAESEGSYELVRGDVRDEELVDSLVENTDYVFHEAAQAGVRTSVENPEKSHDVNSTGTLNVLQAARDSDVDGVVVASSSSVYGKTEYLPFDEDHPTQPTSPYGVSKLAAEQYTRVFAEVYGLPTVALRYFTVYGPRMRPNMAISNFVSRCVNHEPPVIYGNGKQTRDFTYIDDVVNANLAVLENDVSPGEILNIGSGENISIEALAIEIRDQIAPKLSIEYTDAVSGDAENTYADITRARKHLGYTNQTAIREGVSKFIDWYRAERDWYEPLVRSS
jgi:UDP-glucose 4-epimerase